MTGCGANLARVGVRRPPRERRRRREAKRGDTGFRRGGGRCDRLRAGGREARPRPRVREGAGRLLVLVQLLRDPARARLVAQPPRGRGAARDRPSCRAGSPRGRPDRDQSRVLPRPRRRLRPAAARARRRGDAGTRAPPALLDRDQPCQRRADRGAARDAGSSPPSARSAPVGRRPRPARDGPPLHDRDLPAAARSAAGGVQPDERRDRRLPSRGRGRVREHPAHRARRRADEAPRLPVLAAPRHRHGARRSGDAARRSGSGARACAPRRTPRASRAGRRRSIARTTCSSIARVAATATTTRPGSSRAICRSATFVRVRAAAVSEEGIVAA